MQFETPIELPGGSKYAQDLLPGAPITILIPVFNDWHAAEILLGQLEDVFAKQELTGNVLFIDDGSQNRRGNSSEPVTTRLVSVRVLVLKKNLGHQRAICVGLTYLNEKNIRGPVLIMDADGEDGPQDIPTLVQEFIRQGQGKIIFAARARRAEGFLFKMFYQIYRTIHRLLVGFDIRIGNFSLLPSAFLERLAVSSDLWNHYAACVLKTRLPHGTVAINKCKRISGNSKMGFISLVVHGLSAISVFGDVVGVRLLMTSFVFGLITAALLVVTLIIKFGTTLAIPGWATFVVGLLLLLLSQCLLLSLVFTFVVLYSRGQSSFVPLRDCPIYIHSEEPFRLAHE